MQRKWKVWWFGVSIFSAFLGVYYSACNGSETPLILEKNHSESWLVWRPFTTDTKSIVLDFDSSLSHNVTQKDMGDWDSMRDKKEENGPARALREILEEPVLFDEPGEPIELEISLNGKRCLMEALPSVNEYSSRILFGSDGLDIPQQFGGKEAIECSFIETPGFNKWRAKVSKVSPKLQGKKVVITTDSPISFKSAEQNYYWMSYPMLFSVFCLTFMLIFGAVIFIMDSAKARKKSS
ncbi:hypothetical protein [Aggregatibacter kilianii]|uniref:hypothetical protein n=1 Tax=Aggregatibacter kilianii TaxID=2025884 RepID=UPI000D64BED6|nr:hypothetical protein [Aggregatibacter kilianii]